MVRFSTLEAGEGAKVCERIASVDHSIYPIGSMYAIYGNMDPINIPPMLVCIPYMDPVGMIFG